MELKSEMSIKFSKLNTCVLIPTYNNAKTLSNTISEVLNFTNNVIVVNDGSTDDTNQVLSNYNDIKILSYDKNIGKGWALRKGFQFAIEQGYDYAITIDSDGQHFANDLPKFIDKLEEIGPAIIIGARNMDQESVPGKSTTGLKISNFWFNIETGINAPDTQSGYRLFPLHLLKDIKFYTKKFEFEIEVLVRASWNGIKIESVPVKVFYAPANERVSHFRPFIDFTRVSILHTILVVLTFVYINPRNFIRKAFNPKTYKNLKEEAFNPNDSILLIATSIAFGVFMGIVPIWGFQLLVGISLAIIFRLNTALVIIAANISIPPMIPLIIYWSYNLGAYWIKENPTIIPIKNTFSLEMARGDILQYLYGSITLALLAAIISGALTYLLLIIFRKPKKQEYE